eukprot:TRINITY_DN1946_c0_g1_i1.p1 TRINITY_DN1946_c0_g1~~TRINITY_DN1946_c0_g1_i1.p1  ORF type:complete len:100 (-),score=23.77 TRINITY_DN1946_c0_g1_i1:86-385(-)
MLQLSPTMRPDIAELLTHRIFNVAEIEFGNYTREKTTVLSAKEFELQKKEKDLMRWEARLVEKDRMLNERERNLQERENRMNEYPYNRKSKRLLLQDNS